MLQRDSMSVSGLPERLRLRLRRREEQEPSVQMPSHRLAFSSDLRVRSSYCCLARVA